MDFGALTAFFEASPLAFAIIGEDFRPILANPAYARLLQKTGNAGDIAADPIVPRPIYQACKTVFEDGSTQSFTSNPEEGAVKSVSGEVFPLVAAGRKAVGIILREAAESREELEKALLSRTRQVQELQRDMDVFSYSVSHDLRAPVRAAIGFSQALQHEMASSLGGKSADYLARIQHSSQKIGELMDHLLRLSRAARHEPLNRNVSVTEAGLAVRAELEKKHPERKATWVIQAGMSACTDEKYLHELLEILFENALKFTRDTPDARIEFGCRWENGAPRFYVKDNGVGYDPACAEKLFSPFQRMHTQDEFPGVGMGLAIARKVATRMGGRIWGESAPGAGATFFFAFGPE